MNCGISSRLVFRMMFPHLVLRGSSLVACRVSASAFTFMLRKTRHGQLGQDGDHQQDEGKEGAEEEKGEHDVEGTFHHLVGRFAQRVTAQTEVGDIAQHVQVHPVLQVVMQVGHTVEVYQVVFAIVDDGDNVVPVDRRKSAEQVLYLRMVLQVGGYLLGFAQVRTFFRKTGIGLEIEVAVYPVTRKGVVHHFVVQFEVAGCSADQYDVAQVASLAAVYLHQGTESQAVGTDHQEAEADVGEVEVAVYPYISQAVGTDHQEAEADVGEVEVAVYPYIFQNRKGQSGNDGEIHRIAENFHHNLVGIYLAQMQDNAVPAGSHQVTEADDELQGPDGYPRRYRLLVGMAQQVEQQVVEEEIPHFYKENHKTVVTVSLHFHNRELSELKLGQKGKLRRNFPSGCASRLPVTTPDRQMRRNLLFFYPAKLVIFMRLTK